jgi:carbonic anhydrase/acetyltransferase-like protein (isoleucine patch superfamily)
VVAASCLVPEGFEVPPGALVAGVPGKIKKTGLTADWVDDAVKIYVESGRAYLAGLRRLDR